MPRSLGTSVENDYAAFPMSDFFAMGGYAAYVWPAYGVSALALGGLVWLRLRRLKRAREKLAAIEATRRTDA